MLVAYLRGLLKPTLPNGKNSRIREQLILQALSVEMDVEFLKLDYQLEASMVQSPNKVYVDKLQERVTNLRRLMEFEKNFNDNRKAERENFVHLYKMLVSKGILDKVQKDKSCKQVVIRR